MIIAKKIYIFNIDFSKFINMVRSNLSIWFVINFITGRYYMIYNKYSFKIGGQI